MMKFLKFIKDYALELIILVGVCLLFLIIVIYFRTGFDRTIFWQSVLPSAFVDVISVMVTTILISFLVSLNKEYKTKKEFYEIIKMQHIKVFYKLENDYLSIFTTNKYQPISNDNIIELNDIPDYIERLDDDFFRDILFIDFAEKEQINRGFAFLEFEKATQETLLKFIQKYASIMPTDYKKVVFKLDHMLDYSIFPIDNFNKEILRSEHKKFTDTLYWLVNYFDDIDKGKVARNESKEYGWSIISFTTLFFIMCCCLIIFCIYLYNI